MQGILFGIILFFGCYVLGVRVLRLLKVLMEPDEELVIGIGVGLACLGNVVTLMGLSHLFEPVAFFVVFGIFVVLIAIDWKDLVRSFSGLKKIYAAPSSLFTVFLALAALIAVLASLMGVLSPELANDSLCYHLNLPKIFLRAGRFFLAPYELSVMYPSLMEMLYTFGLGLSGVVLAKFIHFGMGILAALTVFTWSRQIADKKVAWAGAALFLTTPSVINEMGVTYVEVGLAFFALLFIFCVWKWQKTQKISWLALSGVFAGACVGIKYLGIMVLIPVFLLIFFNRSPLGPKTKGFFLLSVALTLFGGFWYVRNFLVFRNPVFPYFPSLFGSGDPMIHQDYLGLGVAHTFQNFLALPWTVTLKPELFSGWGDQMGPGYLVFLPLLLWGLKLPLMGGIGFFVLAYFFLWFFAGQMLRFLIPMLPLLAILTTAGWSQAVLRPIVRRSMIFIFCAILGAQAMLAVYHFKKNSRVALGVETRENYLLRHERSYRVARFVNENLPEDAKIYAADETHLYYFQRPVARDVFFSRTHAFSLSLSPEEILRRLRRDGFTHLLQAKTELPGSPSRERSISGMIDRGEMAKFLDPVFSDYYVSLSEEPNCSYVLFRIIPE